jgi:hypothetical protein
VLLVWFVKTQMSKEQTDMNGREILERNDEGSRYVIFQVMCLIRIEEVEMIVHSSSPVKMGCQSDGHCPANSLAKTFVFERPS